MKAVADRLLASLLVLLLLPAAAVAAPGIRTPADLQAAGRLQVASSITPSEGIVPGQRLRLILEIATDRWFTGGTGVGIPEVPGLVILQTEQFAVNASENRGGENWVVQRWTLYVYPQRAGEFAIPPVALDVKVNAGEAGNVEGRVRAPPLTLDVRLPEELAEAEHWVAAPEFSVDQRFDRDLEGLGVGDAFEREITFEARDVMAMMLPVFSAREFSGLAIYPAPAELEDRGNRGESLARRSQRISYVVESEGLYLLPARDFLWWNTRTGKLQVLSLPATEIQVGSGGASDAGSRTDPGTGRQRVLLLAGLAALALGLWLAFVLLPRLPLERLRHWLQSAGRLVAELRKPALPAELNPGSSAGEKKASG